MLNSLEPLPETENFSKGTILWQSKIRSHTATFVIDVIILLARAKIYILHKNVVINLSTCRCVVFKSYPEYIVGLKYLLRWKVFSLKQI